MKDVIICDLDGTLADDTHRAHHLHKPERDWDTYFSLCSEDKLIPAVYWVLWNFRASHKLYILTGRSETTREMTEKWLEQHKVPMKYATLIMRGEHDRTADDQLKIGWAHNLGLKDRTLFVLEDRQRVVDAWRAAGYTCFQVRPGAF